MTLLTGIKELDNLIYQFTYSDNTRTSLKLLKIKNIINDDVFITEIIYILSDWTVTSELEKNQQYKSIQMVLSNNYVIDIGFNGYLTIWSDESEKFKVIKVEL